MKWSGREKLLSIMGDCMLDRSLGVCSQKHRRRSASTLERQRSLPSIPFIP